MGNVHPKIIRSFCDYLEISEDQFWKVVESFRNPDIWRKSDNGEWELSLGFREQRSKVSKVGIIDYGVSNILSVRNALNFLRYRHVCSDNPNELSDCDALVLWGWRFCPRDEKP